MYQWVIDSSVRAVANGLCLPGTTASPLNFRYALLFPIEHKKPHVKRFVKPNHMGLVLYYYC